jgi:hypothetical protein
MWHAWGFAGITWREKTLGTRRRRWKDNIKMDIKTITWKDVNLIDVANGLDKYRAVVNTVMNIWVP